MTGKSINEKIERIRSDMTGKGANVLVVTALDEVACKLHISIFRLFNGSGDVRP